MLRATNALKFFCLFLVSTVVRAELAVLPLCEDDTNADKVCFVALEDESLELRGGYADVLKNVGFGPYYRVKAEEKALYALEKTLPAADFKEEDLEKGKVALTAQDTDLVLVFSPVTSKLVASLVVGASAVVAMVALPWMLKMRNNSIAAQQKAAADAQKAAADAQKAAADAQAERKREEKAERKKVAQQQEEERRIARQVREEAERKAAKEAVKRAHDENEKQRLERLAAQAKIEEDRRKKFKESADRAKEIVAAKKAAREQKRAISAEERQRAKQQEKVLKNLEKFFADKALNKPSEEKEMSTELHARGADKQDQQKVAAAAMKAQEEAAKVAAAATEEQARIQQVKKQQEAAARLDAAQVVATERKTAHSAKKQGRRVHGVDVLRLASEMEDGYNDAAFELDDAAPELANEYAPPARGLDDSQLRSNQDEAKRLQHEKALEWLKSVNDERAKDPKKALGPSESWSRVVSDYDPNMSQEQRAEETLAKNKALRDAEAQLAAQRTRLQLQKEELMLANLGRLETEAEGRVALEAAKAARLDLEEQQQRLQTQNQGLQARNQKLQAKAKLAWANFRRAKEKTEAAQNHQPHVQASSSSKGKK